MAKKVQVTSVTPAIKTKAVSKAQQSRTRAIVMGIATATPVGRGAKAVATAAKAVKAEATMAKAGWNSAAKANYRAQVKREADAIAKNSVKTKPAAKPVGNPPNDTKAWEDYVGSVSRGAPGRGPAGKAKAIRVANSKTAKNTVPSAKKPARIPEVPAGATVKINSAKTTRVVRVNPKKVTSSSTSAVKRVTRKVAPKTGLETRGAKPTRLERINRARDLQWNKAEKNYDAGNEMRYTGLVSSNKGMVAARGAGKKNARKSDAIRREANKDLPIQINSARSFTSPSSGNMFRGTDILKANNARALKAANRTRAGKPAKKK